MSYAFRFLAALVVFAAVTAAAADFYQYTDEHGTVVVVDDAGKIPPRYRKQRQRRDVAADLGGRSTGVTIRNNRVMVPVTLTYRGRTAEVVLLLDTGASTTMITTSVAERLGIPPAATEVRRVQVADGRVLDSYLAVLDGVTVGPKVQRNLEVSIMPTEGRSIGADGLLGMNFLGAHPYHLDMNTRALNWME